jgi:phosphoribosylformylglycinamidine synthase
MSKIVHYYRKTPTPHSLLPSIKEQLSAEEAAAILRIDTESCFNVQLTTEEGGALAEQDTARLEWLLAETFDKGGLQLETSFLQSADNVVVMEFGPRMTFTSAFSSNATSICAACGLDAVTRLERSRRYAITFSSASPDHETIASIKRILHDRMTEEEYATPLTSFEAGVETKEIQWVPIMEEGRAALEKINDEMGLGFDEWDLDYYTDLFQVGSID